MATATSPQKTDFSLDVLGRYACNGFDEALDIQALRNAGHPRIRLLHRHDLLDVLDIVAERFELFEGDRESAVDWLRTAQTAMGGAIPLQIARSEMGAREVEAVLGRLEYGVFS